MIIGLTGGIGSGKSQAANFFKKEGVTVIDTDKVARDVIKKGTDGFQSIVDYFDADIFDTDGSIDRGKLRSEVFENEEKRKALELIIHPLVREQTSIEIAASKSLYSIIMVPLIFETNSMSAYNRILVIDCDIELQIERATSRDNCSKDLIQKIIDSQCSRDQRLGIANDVIPNNDSLKNLQMRSIAIHKFYLGLSKK